MREFLWLDEVDAFTVSTFVIDNVCNIFTISMIVYIWNYIKSKGEGMTTVLDEFNLIWMLVSFQPPAEQAPKYS